MRATLLAPLLVIALTASSCGFMRSVLKQEARSVVHTAVAAAVVAVIWHDWTEDEWQEQRAVAKEESKGLERYSGPRYKIKAEGTKLAAMPLKAQDVEPKIAFIMDDLLLTELSDGGFDAIGSDDINQMLGFERLKDEAGCDEPDCAANVGNALGVPYLTSGNVASLDGSTVITLKLMDVHNSIVTTRVSKISEGGTNAIPRVIAEVVQEMVQKSAL